MYWTLAINKHRSLSVIEWLWQCPTAAVTPPSVDDCIVLSLLSAVNQHVQPWELTNGVKHSNNQPLLISCDVVGKDATWCTSLMLQPIPQSDTTSPPPLLPWSGRSCLSWTGSVHPTLIPRIRCRSPGQRRDLSPFSVERSNYRVQIRTTPAAIAHQLSACLLSRLSEQCAAVGDKFKYELIASFSSV